MAWVVGIGVALFLLFAFPKQIGILIGVAALLIVGAIGIYWINATQKERELSHVKLSAFYQPGQCSQEYPILINFENGTDKIIEKISFDLNGFRPGFSEAVSTDYYLSSDRIINPGANYRSCWKYHKGYGREFDPSKLQWEAVASNVHFR